VHAVLKAWGITPERQAEILTGWKTKVGGSHPGLLNSYMMDITIEVMKVKDTDGTALTSKTLDVIGSKGTGLWSVQEALGVGCPAPSLEEAVIARQMSMYREERQKNATAIDLPLLTAYASDEDIEDLYWGAALSIIASYAQMFQCLRALDKEFNFGLNFPATIATFRAGCILQGYLLQPMTEAFEKEPNIPSLMCAFAPEITQNLHRFKRLAGGMFEKISVSAPVMIASLGYIQTMTMRSIDSAQITALQRDVFGRHGFKRLDKPGDFNHQWPPLQGPALDEDHVVE
jgi:6-phosphogluconate dehydrogenase